MKQMWKKVDINHTGESWFSHKVSEGVWCNGKEKKQPVNMDALIKFINQLGDRVTRLEQFMTKGSVPVTSTKSNVDTPF